jgi:hypothetical protein
MTFLECAICTFTVEAMATDGSTLPIDGLLATFRVLLRPLARIAVAAGVPYARIDEVLRQVLVEAASAAHSALPSQRRVSRISTTLGLNRREVTRLHRSDEALPPPPPSHATRLFLKWHSDPRFRDAEGRVATLPRQGLGLTFEQLAHEVTRDVHPRSLLGELCRLGLARHDEGRDVVELIVDAFVPRGDSERMLAFLGANVGDHFEAAVSNVLGDGREHFEQAIFADELSAESVSSFRDTITRQWQALRQAAVPVLESLIQADQRAGRRQDQRLRLGLFSWSSAMQPAPAKVPQALPAERPGESDAAIDRPAGESTSGPAPAESAATPAVQGNLRKAGRVGSGAAKPKNPSARGAPLRKKDAG